jgi:hypothetical protein
MKWCVDYTEFCLVIKFKHKIPSVCMQKIFLLALWSQKIKYFMQPCLHGKLGNLVAETLFPTNVSPCFPECANTRKH